MFKIATGGNILADTSASVKSAYEEVLHSLGSAPDYLMVQMNAAHEAGAVQDCLRSRCPGAQVHGATSCGGTITDAGVHAGGNSGLAIFAIKDEDGCYGTGLIGGSEDPGRAALEALDRALVNAGRQGELPDLIWITCNPGDEEEVLQAIQTRVGRDTPIVGGSAADNDISGQWLMFDLEHTRVSGCLVSVLFSSVDMGSSFQSAYVPTERSAKVTEADNRTIRTLDGRPAAEVYMEWLGREMDLQGEQKRVILQDTTLAPLGRVVGTLGQTRMFLLSHPEAITADGSLTTFTRAVQGEELHLMTGTAEMLVKRASRVCTFASNLPMANSHPIAGAIIVYCAGCMLTVSGQLEELRQEIGTSLDGAPFITAFTFGEQGQVVPGINCHGNLMVSAIVWRSE